MFFHSLGYENGDGKFTVEEYLFYEGGPQRPLKDLSNNPLLILISGLDQVRKCFLKNSHILYYKTVFLRLPIYITPKKILVSYFLNKHDVVLEGQIFGMIFF